jgi:hypothetical protein
MTSVAATSGNGSQTSEDSDSSDGQEPPLYELFAELDLNRNRAVFNPSSIPDLVFSAMQLDQQTRSPDNIKLRIERSIPWIIDPVSTTYFVHFESELEFYSVGD